MKTKKELLEIRKKIKDNDESKRRTINDKTTELKEILNKQGERIQKLEDEVQEKNPKIIVVEETEIKDNDTIATCGAGTGVSSIRIKNIKHFVEYFKKFFSTKEENKDSITNEATARANEDKKLQISITNEATARANEDKKLQISITNEATTRANEDKKLQTSITNEVNARSSAISSVNATISNFQKSIANEATTRSNEDKKLQTNYNTLNSNYNSLKSSYNTLNTNYNSLKTSYNTLNSNYNSLKTTVTNLQNELNTIGGWKILATTTGSGAFGTWEQDKLTGNVVFKVNGYISSEFNASDLKRNNNYQCLLRTDKFSLWNDYPWFRIKSENNSFNEREKITVYYRNS